MDSHSSSILKELKENIIKVLEQNITGLPLAQIPIALRKNYKKTYNLQALGFPKLKNLLNSMDEVALENTLDNNVEAKLKKNTKKIDDNNLQNPINNPKTKQMGINEFIYEKHSAESGF